MGQKLGGWVQSWVGGSCPKYPPPPLINEAWSRPPPLKTPKVFETVFLQFEIWGKLLAPKAPKAPVNFVGLPREFFFTVCVYTQNTQSFAKTSKMGEKHKNN